jgi:hypothetical protein
MQGVGVSSVKLVHEIHVSELRSFRACRRRWSWLFQENRQPLITATPLEFGIAFHRAMQVMYDPKTWHLDRYALGVRAETAFIEACKEQRANFIRVTQKYGLSDEEEKNYETNLELGVGMIRWYAKTHLVQNEFAPVEVEAKFSVSVLDAEGNQLMCKCDRCFAKYCYMLGTTPAAANNWNEDIFARWGGLPVVYEGRIDALVLDKNGGYWILDWKTTMRMMSEDSDVILETDDQVASYCWALRVVLGLNIRGFLYVELRKDFPKPPTRNKTTRLGCAFSVSKSQGTDHETYRATVMAEDPIAYQNGLYDEFLEWLKSDGPRFIQVHKVYKPPQTLDNIGHYIYLQARDMIEEPTIYPSPGRFVCGWCPFQGPCIDATAGRDYEYALNTMYEVKPRYYELEPSTDRRI